MTRETARKLNEEFGMMVEEFCRKHNLEKVHCRLSYNDASLDWKVSTSALDANGERKIDPATESRAQWCLIKHGIKAPEKIIGTYANVIGLGRCKIIDFNSRAPKYPFSVETASGQVFRTGTHTIKF